MKKATIIILSIALLVSLEGCHAVTPSGSSSVFNSPSSELLSAASSEDTSAMTATNGTPENHITYIESGNDYYALSYMKQGVQILKGVKGIDWDVAEIEPNVPKGENLKKHYVPVMKSNGEKISPEEKLWYSNAGKVVSSNGSWDFFPTKVRYEEYTLDNQPDKPEWKKYFLSKIQEKSDDTPVIYLPIFLIGTEMALKMRLSMPAI